jgi:(p)ppGpp synthase/HD superfamily hydrolase
VILSNRFSEALTYAAELHATQVHKGSGIPYIAHLLGTASIALEYGASEDEALAKPSKRIVALLHDAIEDCGGPPIREAIRQRFGDTLTAIVDGCTDSNTTPKPPWQQRKAAYIDRILTASGSVRLVSAADKLYNARSILKDYRELGDLVWERFKGKKDGTLWYYNSLVESFRQVELTPIVEELTRTVLELNKLSEDQR